MRLRWIPISAPEWTSRTRASGAARTSWSCIAASRAVDGGRKSCSSQEPAQQIPRAVRSAARERDERCPIERRRRRRRSATIAPSRVLRGELVDELRGFGLMRGAPRERRRIAWKRRGEAGGDLVADEVALDVGVGVRLVVDPGERARRWRRRRSPSAAARATAAAAPARIARRAAPASRRARAAPRRAGAAAAAFRPGRRRGARARRSRRRRRRAPRSAPRAPSASRLIPPRRSTRARCTTSGTPRFAHSAAQNAAHASALADRPWWTCSAESATRCPGATRARASRSAIESRPPESATAMRVGRARRRARSDGDATSASRTASAPALRRRRLRLSSCARRSQSSPAPLPDQPAGISLNFP